MKLGIKAAKFAQYAISLSQELKINKPRYNNSSTNNLSTKFITNRLTDTLTFG